MNGGGKNPSWPDEEFCIDVKYIGDDCRLAVMDENNVGSNDVVGEATIKLSAMCCDGGFDEWTREVGLVVGMALRKASRRPREGREMG